MDIINIVLIVLTLLLLSVLLTGIISYTYNFIKIKKSTEKYLKVRTVKNKRSIFWVVILALNCFFNFSQLISSLSQTPEKNASRVILYFCAVVCWLSGLFMYLEIIFMPFYVSEKHIFGINGLFDAEKCLYIFGKKEDNEENLIKVFQKGIIVPFCKIKAGEKQKYSDEVKNIMIQNFEEYSSSSEKKQYASLNKNHLVLCSVIFAVFLIGFICFYFTCRPLEWLVK